MWRRDQCNGQGSKIRESHVFRNTKLKRKGRGNTSTFNRLSSISSSHARFSSLAYYVRVRQITSSRQPLQYKYISTRYYPFTRYYRTSVYKKRAPSLSLSWILLNPTAKSILLISFPSSTPQCQKLVISSYPLRYTILALAKSNHIVLYNSKKSLVMRISALLVLGMSVLALAAPADTPADILAHADKRQNDCCDFPACLNIFKCRNCC
jgi:hypothetical protein